MRVLSDSNELMISECVFDMTQEVDYFLFSLRTADIDWDLDSREIFHNIHNWAVDFENNVMPRTHKSEYLEQIVSYTRLKIEKTWSNLYEQLADFGWKG